MLALVLSAPPVLVLAALPLVDTAAVVSVMSAAPVLAPVGGPPGPNPVVAGAGEHAPRDRAERAAMMAFMAF